MSVSALQGRGSRSAARAPRVLLVTGGKGGVGKTTLAVNLALALRQAGRDPLLVDLDFGLANVDVLLGLEPRATSEDFWAGRRSCAECIERGPLGLRVLAAGSGSFALARPDPERPARLLEALVPAAGGDLVVGDAPAGIGADVLDVALCAERVLVVTTPEPAARADACGVLRAIDGYAAHLRTEVPTPELFVNCAADAADAARVAQDLRATCERAFSRSPRLAGWLPRTPEVLASVLARRPFVLDGRGGALAAGLEDLARRYAALAPGARGAPDPL